MKFEYAITILAVILVATLVMAVSKAGEQESRTEARWEALKEAFSSWFLLPPKTIFEKQMCSAPTPSTAVARTPSCQVFDNRGCYGLKDCSAIGVYEPGATIYLNGTKQIASC